MATPTGTCPHCGKNVRLNNSGTLYAHRDGRGPLYCNGTRLFPTEGLHSVPEPPPPSRCTCVPRQVMPWRTMTLN